MKFFVFVVFFYFTFTDASVDSTGSQDSENEINHGSSGSNGYGYSGSFSGSGPANFPQFPPIPTFDFSGTFSNYLDSLQKQHQEFIKQPGSVTSFSYASSSPGSSALSHSSISFSNSFNGGGLQSLAQAGSSGNFQGGHDGSSASGYGGVGNRGGFSGGYGGGFSGPDGQSFSFSGPLGDAGAFASGSIGPDGIHQTASVFPENPNAPNVNTRFGGAGAPAGGDFKSVFTSSKSVTSNVGGKPQTFRQASTTVNDNGKVTTYTAHNP